MTLHSLPSRVLGGVAAGFLLLGATACGQSTETPAAPATTQTTTQAATTTTAPVATTTVTATTTAASATGSSEASTTGSGSSSTTSASSGSSSQLYSKVVTYQGMGGFQLGRSGQELERLDLAEPSEGCEKQWSAVNASREIDLGFDGTGRLTSVLTRQKQATTPSGARIGMTFAQLQQVYPKLQMRPVAVAEELKITVGRVTDGQHALYFGAVDEAGEWTDARPTDTVAWIATQPAQDSLVFGC